MPLLCLCVETKRSTVVFFFCILYFDFGLTHPPILSPSTHHEQDEQEQQQHNKLKCNNKRVHVLIQLQAIDEKLVFGYGGKPQTMATRYASAPTTALFIVLLYI